MNSSYRQLVVNLRLLDSEAEAFKFRVYSFEFLVSAINACTLSTGNSKSETINFKLSSRYLGDFALEFGEVYSNADLLKQIK
jgi:hypothetical protein